MLHKFAKPLLSAIVTWVMLASASARAGTVNYQVTFDATWSSATHPLAIPVGAHFSPLIGGTHNDQVRFWQDGGTASLGIESMAETGSRTALSSHIQDAISAGNAHSLILGGGTNSPGAISTMFEVSSDFPLVTLVTMIAPSPDWFVGVAGLSLRANDQWLESVTVDLLAYDAGTDSGESFTSPDLDTSPRGTISRLGAPFDGTTPLGTFTFKLVPEPSGLLLGGIGAFAILSSSRRRRYLFVASLAAHANPGLTKSRGLSSNCR